MSTDDRRTNPLLQPDIAEQNMRGMADCMDMVRRELIEAGIIEANVAPMFVANAVVYYMQMQATAANAEARFADEMADRAKKAEAEAAHWKANHATEVSRARILKERTDMPVERVRAYEHMGTVLAENEGLKTELIAAYASRATLFDLCEGIAKALERPETPLEGLPWGDLVEVTAQTKEEAQRFAACRHQARQMPEDGGEDAFLIAIDMYRAEHGL